MRIALGLITIVQEAARRDSMPPVRLTNPDFRQGYYSGLQEGLHGLSAGSQMTDEDVMTALVALAAEGGFTDPADKETWFAVGSLLGRIKAGERS